MTFSDNYILTFDSGFQERVRMAVLKSAVAILGGAASGQGATVDTKREKLAIASLTGGPVGDANTNMTPDTVYNRFLWTCASQAPTNDDTNVENSVTSVWNDIAGILSTDPA